MNIKSLTSSLFKNDEQMQNLKQEFERRLREQENAIQDLKNSLVQKRTTELELANELQALETRLTSTSSELDERQRSEIELSKQNSQIKEQLKSMDERLSYKLKEFASLTQDHEMMKADTKLNEVKMHNMESNNAEQSASLNAMTEKAANLKVALD